MRIRNYIFKFTAGLILSVLVFLFLHSETEIFDTHTDNCKDVDICLILDNVNFEKNQNLNKTVVLAPVLLNYVITNNYEPVQDYLILEYRFKYLAFITPFKIFLKEQKLLI